MLALLKAIKGSVILKNRLSKSLEKKIVVGASGVFENGWIPTDVHTLNLLKPSRWKLFFSDSSIDIILAEHVWEHLTQQDGEIAAKTCFRFLKNGGHLRVAVPDGFHPDEKYIGYVKPGGSGAGADDHKVLYNNHSFTAIFQKAGFDVVLLEYFDEKGEFHFIDWDKKDGMIHRSSRYDERNIEHPLSYTSLILDARKK